MPFSEEELKKLRSELPRGAGKALAIKLNMAHGTIRNILSGRNNNEIVILEALALAEAHKKAIEAAKSKITSL